MKRPLGVMPLKLLGCQLCIITIFSVLCTNGFAEPTADGIVTARTAEMVAPIQIQAVWMEETPVISEKKKAQLEYWQDRVNLPGPGLEYATESRFEISPEAGTESILGDLISAPGDAILYRVRPIGNEKIPIGFRSNVMETSVGTGGKWVVLTGNWFAARTLYGGGVWLGQWVFIDPSADMPDFCCDQIAIYDASRDAHYWLRLGLPGTNSTTGNYENRFRLSVSNDGMQTFWNYDITPANVNSAWTDEFWDYPHIQIGANFMYIAWNLFTQTGAWARTVMLRWPLDELAAAESFSYSYMDTNEWFTFVPVQGASHRMYWASNWPDTVPQNSRLRIWWWDEDSSTIFWVDRIVPSWTATGRGSAQCGSASGNWAARYDQRVLSGARYSIMNADLKNPGRQVLGWWWNVAQGGSFPQPYIEAAAFWEDDLTQVAGDQGRPLVWGSNTCFAYPSVAANKRQDLGMIFHYSTGVDMDPAVGFAMADDISTAPPGWLFYNVKSSSARPIDNKWGDYNTVREFEPTQKAWIAGSHFISWRNDCTNCAKPVYFVFGRERDIESYERWRTK